MSIKQITQMAMLAAISIILVSFLRFPIIPIAPFLEYTPGDVPLFMATILYGPAAGLILAIATAIIQGMTVSAHSGIIGIIMNIFSSGSYAIVAGLIYHKSNAHSDKNNAYSKNKTKRAAIAMTAGVLAVCISMIGWNLIFTPIFMGVPREVVVRMILPAFLPFNLIRAGVNSAIAFAAWRAVASYIKAN